MGMSLSADVFYGFDLGYGEDRYDDDTQPAWLSDGEDWEEVYARKHGWIEVPFPNTSRPAGLNDARLSYAQRDNLRAQWQETPEYQAWSSNRDEMRAIVAACPVEIDHYGYEFDALCVRVKTSVQKAGYEARRLDPLATGDDWARQVIEFAELMELPVPEQGPGWHVSGTYA